MLRLRKNGRDIYVKKLVKWNGTATIFFNKDEVHELGLVMGEWVFFIDREHKFTSKFRRHRDGLQFTFPKVIFEILDLDNDTFIGLEINEWGRTIRIHKLTKRIQERVEKKWDGL